MYRWLLLVLLVVAGAVHAQTAERGAPDDILALPPALREQFTRDVLAGQPSRRLRLERMVDFVFDAGGLGMRYQDDATHTVAEAYATRTANCLGFTLLFLALSREAGLEAWPQAWDDTLSWRRAEGILYRNGHVNAVIRIGPRQFSLDVARGAVITRGHPVRLTQRALLARYHNNRAVEALDAGDLDAARRHMATALELDPGQASHWSNAGVLERHGGDDAAARRDYERALALDPENTNALFNLVTMARRDGDAESEARFRERLTRVQQKDPLHHFLQAVDFELAGDYTNAIAHYRQAIRLHGGDPRFHAALAGALESSGDFMAARKALRVAISLSDGNARQAYRERLAALRGR
jgi:Flp pilus assembly protein TadD